MITYASAADDEGRMSLVFLSTVAIFPCTISHNMPVVVFFTECEERIEILHINNKKRKKVDYICREF